MPNPSPTTFYVDPETARQLFGDPAEAPSVAEEPMESEPLLDPKAKKQPVDGSGTTHTQWANAGNNCFVPMGTSIHALPAGIYMPTVLSGNTVGLESVKIQSDSIYQLPDMATTAVLEEVEKFWQSEPKYRRNNLLFKRGLLLYGPPGGGKTCTLKLLMDDLVTKNGIVVVVGNVTVTSIALKALRRVEPMRHLIVVFEDIDEIIRYSSEAQVLSMLDGEDNVDRCLFLATTNYIDNLSARIANRPSRFDRRIHVGMPSAEARTAYLKLKTNDGLSEGDLAKWTSDTEGMSIAHLKELVVSVYCLDQSYDDVMSRLISMAQASKSETGFKDTGKMGFK